MTDNERAALLAQAMQYAVPLVKGLFNFGSKAYQDRKEQKRLENMPASDAMLVDPPEAAAVAKIFLFRPGGGDESTVFYDSNLLVSIGGRQYYITWICPGVHVFASEHRTEVVRINFVAGTQYHLILEPSFWAGKTQVKLCEEFKWRDSFIKNKLKSVTVKQVLFKQGPN